VLVETALIKAISAIHRSDSLDSFESAFLSHASAAIGAEAFGVYLLDPQRRTPEKFFGTGAPRAFLEEYETHRALDPIYEFVMRQRSVADGAKLLGARAWRNHPLRAWLRNWGLQQSLQGPLVIKGEVAGTVNFARGSAGGAFSARSCWLAQVICEEVSATLERLLQQRETVTQLKLFTSCFESVPMPLVICDGHGEARVMNRSARSARALPLRQRQAGDPLCRIAQVVAELATSSKEALAVRADGGETFMSVRLRGFDDLFLSAWEPLGGPPGSLLDALPERSREVAELLVQGKQNKWIAWKLGISPDTVKYHVRRVYSLLEVSSRIELVRCATRGRKQ
jgi:DNA-binding CsgD family transcriptional regulator